jgi:hypothetical protein
MGITNLNWANDLLTSRLHKGGARSAKKRSVYMAAVLIMFLDCLVIVRADGARLRYKPRVSTIDDLKKAT